MLWKLVRIRQKCYFLTLLDSYFVFQAENRWRQLELGVALQYSLCLCYDSIFQLFNKRNHDLILKAKYKICCECFYIFTYSNKHFFLNEDIKLWGRKGLILDLDTVKYCIIFLHLGTLMHLLPIWNIKPMNLKLFWNKLASQDNFMYISDILVLITTQWKILH